MLVVDLGLQKAWGNQEEIWGAQWSLRLLGTGAGYQPSAGAGQGVLGGDSASLVGPAVDSSRYGITTEAHTEVLAGVGSTWSARQWLGYSSSWENLDDTVHLFILSLSRVWQVGREFLCPWWALSRMLQDLERELWSTGAAYHAFPTVLLGSLWLFGKFSRWLLPGWARMRVMWKLCRSLPIFFTTILMLVRSNIYLLPNRLSVGQCKSLPCFQFSGFLVDLPWISQMWFLL